jgi:mono/diheme cytochrome c family protein
MKAFFKWMGIILGIVVLLIAAAGAYVNFNGFPNYPVEKKEFAVNSTPEKVAHGRKLVLNLCYECHNDQATGRMSGRMMIDLPQEFGLAYSRNITQDKEHGIGNWTNGELAWVLRTGIHPHTGRYLPPWMVKLPRMSDHDLESIITFLRSDDPLVQPSSVPSRDSEPSFLAKLLCRIAFKPFDYPAAPVAAVDTNNKVAYGKYLATAVYDCYACHSADFKTMDNQNPEKSEGFMGGGNMLLDASRKPIYSSNITFDKSNGIGNWTEAQFIQAMRHGFRPDGSLIRYPMGRMPNITDNEGAALYAYLQTVPVLNTAHKPSFDYSPVAKGERGREIYYEKCVYCHSETGRGVGDLTAADKKYPSDEALISVIRNSSTFYPDTKMPVWEGKIAEADFPALAAYVRALCRKKSS